MAVASKDAAPKISTSSWLHYHTPGNEAITINGQATNPLSAAFVRRCIMMIMMIMMMVKAMTT